MRISAASAQYHRSRAKLELLRASQANGSRASDAHAMMARLHLARSDFMQAFLDHPSPENPVLVDKES
jgi:hypothetical protein